MILYQVVSIDLDDNDDTEITIRCSSFDKDVIDNYYGYFIVC